jgi:hypothetical protein
MSEPLAPQTPPPAPTPIVAEPATAGGFFQNLIDVYFSPREAFSRIVARPAFLLPLAAYFVLVLGFTGLWMSRMDPVEFMKVQLEESGQAEKMTAEQRQQVIDQQSKMMPVFGWVGSIVGTAVVVLLVSGVLLFVYRFFYAAEVSFKQALAIVSWVMFAVGLVTTPLLILVMQLKGDWNLNPQYALQAHLGLLVDKQTAAKPLYALLSSVDFFSLWMVFLLAVGFAVASRKTTGSAIWGVAIPWIVIVLIKVGWAAIF